MQKYEFTGDTLIWGRHLLNRIRAVRDFGTVKAGDLGGWIETEDNLSHNGNCWVSDEAKVFCHAVVSGNAKVLNNAMIYDKATISGNAKIKERAIIRDQAQVSGDALVSGDANVFGKATICEDALVTGNVKIFDAAKVSGQAVVCGEVKVFNNAKICGWAEILDKAEVFEEAVVSKGAVVFGRAKICRNAMIKKPEDFFTIESFGDGASTISFFQCADKIPRVREGRLCATLDDFLKVIEIEQGKGKYFKVCRAAVELAKVRFGV